jgi:hypothetical protein
MNVAQLIAQLRKLDPSLEVFIECEDAYYSKPLEPSDVVLGVCATHAPYEVTTTENRFGDRIAPKTITIPERLVWSSDADMLEGVSGVRPALIITC